MKNSLNVLFITHVTNMAGANRSMFQLILELRNSYNVKATVLGPYDGTKSGIKKHLLDIGVEYIDGPVAFFKISNPNRVDFIRYVKYLLENIGFYKSLKPYKFNIVHSNSSVIDIGAYLSKLLRCKHIWHFREFGDLDYKLYPIGGNFYEQFTYRHADAIIAISNVVACHYYKKVKKDRIHVIYNGIRDVDCNKISTHENKKVQFFCAGILSESKNQKEIVQAVDVLAHRYNVLKFHVTFVGRRVEPYATELEQMIENRNLCSYFTILSESDGIQDIAKTMDVGIVPSHAEAFGRVTVEYQLQNLFVIGNNQGANFELISHGKTGMIYHKSDYNELAEIMYKVINNEIDWKCMANEGLKHAKANFLSEYNTKAIFELYNKIL